MLNTYAVLNVCCATVNDEVFPILEYDSDTDTYKSTGTPIETEDPVKSVFWSLYESNGTASSWLKDFKSEKAAKKSYVALKEKLQKEYDQHQQLFNLNKPITVKRYNEQVQIEPQMLYSSKEVAKLLGLTKTTIVRLSNKGEFPAPSKIGGSLRWAREDLVSFIKGEFNAEKTQTKPR